jgi:hypothetical protein
LFLSENSKPIAYRLVSSSCLFVQSPVSYNTVVGRYSPNWCRSVIAVLGHS